MKAMSTAVFLFIFVVGFMIIKDNPNISGITGKVISDTSKLTEVVENTGDTIEKIDEVAESTGLKDLAKDKVLDILGVVDTKSLIENILLLRENSNDRNTIMIASTITSINKEIEDSKPVLKKAWQDTLECVFAGCEDDVYLELIDYVALQNLKGKNQAIHSLIETYTFWNINNVLYFSESLTKTNAYIEEFESEKITALWEDLVDCDGKCIDFTEQTFVLISAMNTAQ